MVDRSLNPPCEKDFQLSPLLASLMEKKAFTGELLKDMSQEYNERFWKALHAVAENRVKQYRFIPSQRIRWIVVGRERDYLIIPDHYCSCQDFYIKVVIQRETQFCYHLLAKIIAESLDLYITIDIEDDRYFSLMQDWKLINTAIQD